MSDMRVIKTRSRVNDKHVRGDSSSSPEKVIDTAKLGLKRQKLDKSNLSENSARDEKLKELACVAIQGEASNEVPDPSEIVFDSAEKTNMLFEKYRDVQVNFDKFRNSKYYTSLTKMEQNDCEYKYKQVDTLHEKCMDLRGKVNAPDQAGEELNKAYNNLNKAIKEFEPFRKGLESAVEARQRIKEVGLSGIDKQDLHYIVSINTNESKEYINSIIEKNKGNRTVEGKLIPSFLRAYEGQLDNFASALKTGEIDTAYDHLGIIKNAAIEVESQLKVYHFGSRLFERIDFEFKNVRDI